jgi:hypothetical protein
MQGTGYAGACDLAEPFENLRPALEHAETIRFPHSVLSEQVSHHFGIISPIRAVGIADGQPPNFFNILETR